MVFFLKVNRDENYTYRNLEQWIRIVRLFDNPIVYIQCDKEVVLNRIIDKTEMGGMKPIYINTAFKDDDLRFIVDSIAEEQFKNPAFAHLTTFKQAHQDKHFEYWNIDADDTLLCANEDVCADLMKKVRRVAIDKKIQLYSLDMWYSKTSGFHWSFGITFVHGREDFLETCLEHCNSFWPNSIQPHNVDGYFNYLDQIKALRLGTWYADNMRFIHYSDDFFQRLWVSWFNHWHDGVIEYPLLKICGFNEVSEINIPESADCIEKITDNAFYQFILSIQTPFNRFAISKRINTKVCENDS